MRILFIVPYPTFGPSNRFRVEQYLPYIKQNGHDYALRPFYNISFYNILYEDGLYFKKICYFILLTFRRIIDIFCACRYDLIFIHREAYPLGGAIFEHFFKVLGKKIIYDFDDSIFLPGPRNYSRLRNLFRIPFKIKKIIAISNSVIAGNNYLRDYALNYNSNVHVLPTPIDTDKYFALKNKIVRKDIIVGWIGSNMTLRYLKMLNNVFKEISNRYKNVLFLVIGKGFKGIGSLNIKFREWSLESEVKFLQSFDIGIMPLPDDDWARGKCAFKAIQYMAVGIPVIASNVGMNKEVIEDDINGFLVNNEKEWIDKLSVLVENPELRCGMGLAGRKIAEEKYSVKINAPKFLDIITKVYNEDRKGKT